MLENYLNFSIEKLGKLENLSARSINVCEYNNLHDLVSIIKFQNENNDFFKLRNCGKKTNNELISICEKYKYFQVVNNNEVSQHKNELQNLIDNLSVRQKNILNNIIVNLAEELSIRSINVLKKHIVYEFNIKWLTPYLVNENIQLRNFKNIGQKSELELIDFFKTIKDYIEILSIYENDNDLVIELYNSYLIRKFKVNTNIVSEIWKKYDSNQGIPIFKSCSLLIDNGIIFEKKQTEIFKKCLNFYTCDETISLEEVSLLVGISRERSRQIRKSLLDSINNIFSFLNGLEIDTINLYGIDINAELILISDEIVNQINIIENNDFNILFINKIFSIILKNTHTLIGNEDILLLGKTTRYSHQWEVSYLIKKEVTNVFDFNRFVDDISRRLNSRIEDDYCFHFETYLTKFFKIRNYKYLQNIFTIAEQVIFSEFQLTLDQHENIVFHRNIPMQVFEYAYQGLEKLGKPSKVSEIYNKVIELYPNFKTDEKSIRASMKRNTGFVPFGRTSVYGLCDWEKEGNIKGGTIRDIVEEYLINQDKPMHIDEITDYVLQYRKTNSKNILYNLKMEVHNRFVFYSGSIVGLKSKEYDCSDLVIVKKKHIEIRSWDENFELLDTFTQEHGYLPSPSGNDEEIRLYRFMNVQINKIKKQKLDSNKTDKLQKLLDSLNFFIKV